MTEPQIVVLGVECVPCPTREELRRTLLIHRRWVGSLGATRIRVFNPVEDQWGIELHVLPRLGLVACARGKTLPLANRSITREVRKLHRELTPLVFLGQWSDYLRAPKAPRRKIHV